ncbi:hypothetical protein EC968_003673 [Mortierella alpina]|nr:hypothetical protein EC968_003673 [Mortierella alpina]
MSRNQPSLDHIPILPMVVASSSAVWALSAGWSSSVAASVSTIAVCLLLALYLYRHYALQKQQPQPACASQRNHDPSAVLLPRCLQIQSLGSPVPGSNRQSKKRNRCPPFFFSRPNPCPERLDASQQQQQQQRDTDDKHPLESTGNGLESAQDDQDPCQSARVQASPLTVISKERLEELRTHADIRIWNQVIVGGGREALKSACRIAQQNPCKTILILLEEDIVPDSRQRVVQSLQQKLSKWAQYLWIRETVGTIVLSSQDTPLSYVNQSTSTAFQTRSLEDLSLPSNIFIGSGLCATSILIDKSTTNQPCTDLIPKPVKRFSSVGAQKSSLTINTTPPTPARIVGLEVCRSVESNARLQQHLVKASQQGRVKIQEGDNGDKDETFQLEISASTASYDPMAPIQVRVQVTTQPLRQHAFGNTEAIRHGEAVLMEGLVIARRLAHSAGWTCLEEDDSHMVEWVRDQMDIQWLPGTATDAETLLPACSNVEGVHTLVRSRTSSSGSLRVRTPNLSPYSSRTSSFQGKAKQSPKSSLGVELGVGLGIVNVHDSTLEQLRDASETLQNHKATQRKGESQSLIQDGQVTALGQQDQQLPVVTIAAAESKLASPRPGLKTSFGGFSSLSETRTQTMALAEVTEDHLGMALSFPSPSVGTPSPKAFTPTLDPIAAFSDGVSSSDLLGSPHNASSPPEPRKLNRFSIKTYQMQRSNHGLSDEWALGSLDLTSGYGTAGFLAALGSSACG